MDTYKAASTQVIITANIVASFLFLGINNLTPGITQAKTITSIINLITIYGKCEYANNRAPILKPISIQIQTTGKNAIQRITSMIESFVFCFILSALRQDSYYKLT